MHGVRADKRAATSSCRARLAGCERSYFGKTRMAAIPNATAIRAPSGTGTRRLATREAVEVFTGTRPTDDDREQVRDLELIAAAGNVSMHGSKTVSVPGSLVAVRVGWGVGAWELP